MHRRGMAALRFVSVMVIAAVASHCDDAPTEIPLCTDPTVSLDVDSLILLQDSVHQLIPTFYCGSTPETTPTFTYASSDQTTAPISTTGVVTALAGGRTVVTIAAEGASLEVPVVVFGHPLGELALSTPLADRPFGVAISATGLVYVARYDATSLGRYSLPALAPLTGPSVPSSARDVVFSPDGSRAFVANYDQKRVTSIDVAANMNIGATAVGGRTLRLLSDPISGLVFATTDLDTLYTIHPVTGAILDRAFLPSDTYASGLTGMTLSPDRTQLYVSHLFASQIDKVEVSTVSVLDTIRIGSVLLPEALAISPTGDTLYVAQSAPDYGMYLWNEATHDYLTYLPIPTRPYDLLITPDGAQIYLTAGPFLFIIDRVALSIREVIALSPGPARRIAFDHYGRYAVIADEGGAVHLIK